MMKICCETASEKKMPEPIKVFCRLRPPLLPRRSTQQNLSSPSTASATNHGAVSHSSPTIPLGIDSTTDNDEQYLTLATPCSANEPQQYRFKFHRVLHADATQVNVFECVARPVVVSCLDGYNGCVFAYGQTGSGKTYTMTGGGESYDDRGIIPRVLQYLYREITQRQLSTSPKSNDENDNDGQKGGGDIITVTVSYIEIYNDNGYDLLNPNFRATKLEDLPRIQLFEDAQQQQVRMKNVSVHPVASEKEALDFLFLGDMNRAIAETPMNQASSRSHCLFTLYISARNSTSAAVRHSKLHLVDLAGSERVHRSQIDGRILTEAKYINLSLHHLEQVIIALSENPGGHIPYRNSTMTSILRDSVGGNCMTTMLATISMESANFGETISTCRFAQRVALVKNSAVVNETFDPQLVIEQLRKEVDVLKQQLELAVAATGTNGFAAGDCAELSNEEADDLRERVKKYFLSKQQPSTNDHRAGVAHAAEHLQLPASWNRVYFCFYAARDYYEVLRQRSKPHSTPSSSSMSEEDLQKLRNIVRQRDGEIAVLVQLLKKEKQRAAEIMDAARKAHNDNKTNGTTEAARPASSSATSRSTSRSDIAMRAENAREFPSQSNSRYSNNALDAIRSSIHRYGKDFSASKHEAWLIFQREHPDGTRVGKINDLLRRKSEEAKMLAQKLDECRTDIKKIQNSSDVTSGDQQNTPPAGSNDELELKQTRTRTLFDCLKRCKEETDHLQRQKQQLQLRIQHEFETCWQSQLAESTKLTSGEHVAPSSYRSKHFRDSGNRTIQVCERPVSATSSLSPSCNENGDGSDTSSSSSGSGETSSDDDD